VFHKNVYGAVPPLGVTVNVAEPPAQTSADEGLTEHVGFGLTVVLAVAVAVLTIVPPEINRPLAVTVLISGLGLGTVRNCFIR